MYEVFLENINVVVSIITMYTLWFIMFICSSDTLYKYTFYIFIVNPLYTVQCAYGVIITVYFKTVYNYCVRLATDELNNIYYLHILLC